MLDEDPAHRRLLCRKYLGIRCPKFSKSETKQNSKRQNLRMILKITDLWAIFFQILTNQQSRRGESASKAAEPDITTIPKDQYTYGKIKKNFKN